MGTCSAPNSRPAPVEMQHAGSVLLVRQNRSHNRLGSRARVRPSRRAVVAPSASSGVFVTRALAGRSPVGGEERERFAGRLQDAEMAFVEGEDLARHVAFGEHDDRGVRKANSEVGVALDDLPRSGDVLPGESLKLIGTTLDLREQARARSLAHAGEEEVVDSASTNGDSSSGAEPRQTFGRLEMAALGRVERGEQAAGVEQDHSPKPAASSSSTRSASEGSPLSNNGNRGRG